MRTLGRRGFVRAMGTCALSTPLFGLLASRSRAASERIAKRLIVVFTPNGSVLRHWRPAGGETDFTFPAGSILEPLAPVRDDLVILDGLDFVGASNHEGGMAAMLTGGPGGETGGASVDQWIARHAGGDTRFPSLELGVQTSAWGGNVQTRMSYAPGGAYVPPDDDPRSVYRRVFGEVTGSPEAVEAAVARRRSVIDVLRGDIADLEGRLGTEERHKLDAHLESLRRMEVGLTSHGGAGCADPEAPTALDPYDNDALPDIGRMQTDLLVTALACGTTRVASLQWSHTVGPPVFSWLGIGEGHHALSHMDDGNDAGVRDFVRAERWFAEQIAHLVERLAELPEPEGEGRMLDHTLVLWAKEMGDGRLHECTSVPFVLAGQAGGRLRTGRYLRYDHQAHNALLVSVCRAMGLETETFGEPAHGSGELSGLLS